MKNLPMISMIVVAAHLILSGYACDKATSMGQDTGAKEHKPQACMTDADCMTVKEDCCGCNQGGKQKALARSQEKGWMAELDATCGDMMCMQMISNDASCKKSAVCQEGQCMLK